jgi:hypothetical protein
MRLTKFLITGSTRPFWTRWATPLPKFMAVYNWERYSRCVGIIPYQMKILLHNTANIKPPSVWDVRLGTVYPLSGLFLFCRFCPAEGMGLPIMWLLGSQRPNVREVSFWGEGTRQLEAEQQCHSTLHLAGTSIEWHCAGRLNFAWESAE